MRKNVTRFIFLGLLSLCFFILTFTFSEKILSHGTLIYGITVLFFIGLSILFFSISSSITGKGDPLSLFDLIPGKEYVLIEHVSVDGKKIFSLVGVPDSENFITVQNEDLYKLNPKDHFVVVNKQIRRII